MEIPVFIINGMLESGKTAFIKDTLKGEDFNDGTRTLVIACEEGEEEYDADEMKAVNSYVETVEDIQTLNKDYLVGMCSKYKAQRVFVEFNGMWALGDFIDNLPKFMEIAQIITLVNAQTYDMYFQNMRQVMSEQYKMSEIVIFNRCVEKSDRASYRRTVKAVNSRAQVFFESSDGSSNEISEILPYDITKDEIVLADEDWGIFYMDAMENPQKYKGKIITAKIVVYKPKPLVKEKAFAPGRFAMTCCVEDIRFIGFKCKYDDAFLKELDGYKDREFATLVCSANVEFCKEYKGEGLVLYAKSIEKAQKPADDLVYFN